MARTIRLDQIGDYCQGKVEQLLRVAVLETDGRVKQASPVDTGRFRVSWQVGENSATGEGAPPGSYSGTPPLSRTNYQQETIGNIYSVHNNLPYAEPLANGSSKQAPPGWVQQVAKDIQGFVRTEADRIGRQS